MSYKRLKIATEQVGMVSIMVALVMIVVITMIVMAYSQIIRREQRQTFDRQLNTQAFYAAESSVNLARDTLLNNPTLIHSSYRDDDCTTPVGPPPAPFIDLAVPLDAAVNIEASCVKIDDTVPNLKKNELGNRSWVAPIKSASGANITAVTFQWQDSVGVGGNCNTNPPELPTGAGGSWNCRAGILRVDLVPTNNYTRASFDSGLFTAFFYPDNAGASAVGYGSGNGNAQGSIVITNCNGAGPPVSCTMTVNGLPPSPTYAARVKTIYGTSNVTISANVGDLTGAQAIVDVTGKAQDILRRIQVRIPLVSNLEAPDNALQAADGICKRYLIYDREPPPPLANGPETDVDLTTGGSVANPDGVCNIN